jgi:hypothetical protein
VHRPVSQLYTGNTSVRCASLRLCMHVQTEVHTGVQHVCGTGVQQLSSCISLTVLPKMAHMSDAQKIDPPLYSKRHRIGVAKWLDLILTEIEDMREAIECVLTECQRNASQQDARR